MPGRRAFLRHRHVAERRSAGDGKFEKHQRRGDLHEVTAETSLQVMPEVPVQAPSLVEAAFEDVMTVAGDGDTTVADFVGEYTQRPDGSYEFVHAPLIRAMTEGAVLLIDDATLISAQVLAVAYTAMDGRRVVVKAQKGEVIKSGRRVLRDRRAQTPPVPGPAPPGPRLSGHGGDARPGPLLFMRSFFFRGVW